MIVQIGGHNTDKIKNARKVLSLNLMNDTCCIYFILPVVIQHMNRISGCIKFTDCLIEYINCENAFRLCVSLTGDDSGSKQCFIVLNTWCVQRRHTVNCE